MYLRNTENPLHPAIVRYHPFDGDGMIHKVSFRDGKVSYRNRFVRTDGLLAEQEAGRSLWAGLAENPDVAVRADGWGARGRMKDAASTDVVVHAGVAVASFYQCGDLYRLDPLTLDDLGKCSWGGSFPSDLGVSAHTKVDDRTGELLFFNYSTTAPYLHYGVVDAGNHLVHYVPVDLPGPRLPHDMAFTEHYAILNDMPLFWEPDLIARGLYAARYPPGAAVPARRHPAPRRPRRHPLVRVRADLRAALGQRLGRGRRGHRRRVLPGLPGAGRRRAGRPRRPDVAVPGPGRHADPAAPVADEPGHRGGQGAGPVGRPAPNSAPSTAGSADGRTGTLTLPPTSRAGSCSTGWSSTTR